MMYLHMQLVQMSCYISLGDAQFLKMWAAYVLEENAPGGWDVYQLAHASLVY